MGARSMRDVTSRGPMAPIPGRRMSPRHPPPILDTFGPGRRIFLVPSRPRGRFCDWTSPRRRAQMTRAARAIALLVAGWICCSALDAQERAIQELPLSQPSRSTPLIAEKSPRVFLELRLAETEPVRGLAFEATVKGSQKKIYLHFTTIATHLDVVKAAVVENNGRPAVAITFSPDGAARMSSATARHAGRPVGIIVDGELLGTVTVGRPLGAEVVLSGDFTRSEAMKIATGLERW